MKSTFHFSFYLFIFIAIYCCLPDKKINTNTDDVIEIKGVVKDSGGTPYHGVIIERFLQKPQPQEKSLVHTASSPNYFIKYRPQTNAVPAKVEDVFIKDKRVQLDLFLRVTDPEKRLQDTVISMQKTYPLEGNEVNFDIILTPIEQ